MRVLSEHAAVDELPRKVQRSSRQQANGDTAYLDNVVVLADYMNNQPSRQHPQSATEFVSIGAIEMESDGVSAFPKVRLL
jgi:hypothetical protein